MSNTRRPHPLGPQAAMQRDQQRGNEMLEALPPQVRPHKVPIAFMVGVEPDLADPSRKLIAVNMFHAMGLTALRWTPEEWEQFKAQVEQVLPEVRSGLVVPTPGAMQDLPDLSGIGQPT